VLQKGPEWFFKYGKRIKKVTRRETEERKKTSFFDSILIFGKGFLKEKEKKRKFKTASLINRPGKSKLWGLIKESRKKKTGVIANERKGMRKRVFKFTGLFEENSRLNKKTPGRKKNQPKII